MTTTRNLAILLFGDGKVVTSAGVAAGIDMSLHVVRRMLGDDIATATADHIEYPQTP